MFHLWLCLWVLQYWWGTLYLLVFSSGFLRNDFYFWSLKFGRVFLESGNWRRGFKSTDSFSNHFWARFFWIWSCFFLLIFFCLDSVNTVKTFFKIKTRPKDVLQAQEKKSGFWIFASSMASSNFAWLSEKRPLDLDPNKKQVSYLSTGGFISRSSRSIETERVRKFKWSSVICLWGFSVTRFDYKGA